MRKSRSVLSCLLTIALVGACGPAAGGPGPAVRSEAAEAAPAAPVSTTTVGEITAVRGSAGVRTDDLAEGTFLGAGARLSGGQRLSVPAGTLAELRLDGGAVVRLNEGAVIMLQDPAAGRALALERGELVAIVAGGQAPLRVEVGGEVLEVTRGEARAAWRGEGRSYDLVYGSAGVTAGGRVIALVPGMHVEAPLAPAPRSEVSLRPLAETAWSHAFEAAAAATDAVPAGVGSLTARRAGSSSELHRLALTEQKVHVTISGRIAHTQIEQTFYNEAAEVLEGTYRFPLPADASISGLSLLVGEQWIAAEMLEKQRARRIFREIVDATIPRDPALLEWERGNVFKMRIFPIPGRGARKIRLSYTQVLPAVGDGLRYRFPLAGSGASGEEIGDFEFTVAVDRAELPEGAEVTAPMAALARRVEGDRVLLSTRAQKFRPVHDLGVDLPLPADERRVHAETLLDRDGQAYFMLALRPDLALPRTARPVHYAFVLDRSHSMTPELFTVARGLVRALAGTLGPDDRMTVLACDAACDVAPGGLAPVAAALPAAEAFLDPQALAGASDVGGMMRSAVEALGDAGPDVERVIVYLGDGEASAGELAPDELLRHLAGPLAGVRVQAVALGARADTLVLDALARESGGDLLRADARDDLRGLVRELRLRAAVPVARRVELALPPELVEVHPTALASVRPGDTIVLVGKLRGPARGAVEIRATGPTGQVVTDSFPVELVAAPAQGGGRHTHLPRTWARLEIDALTATRGHAARADIVALSQQYNVLSRYTALIALESDAMYREFGVVRQSGGTTGWNGQLGGPAKAAADPKPSEAGDRAQAPADEPIEAARASKGERAEEAGEAKTRGDRASEFTDEELAASEDMDGLGLTGTGVGGGGTGDATIGLGDLGTIGYGSGLGGIGYGSGYGRGRLYRPTWTIAPAEAPSPASLVRLAALKEVVERDPTSRPAHRKLVQEAIRIGAPEAFAYAHAWAQADPDHAPALLSVADLLAARGDPLALRAYGSAVEVAPFDLKQQARLADALAFKGDLARSCAHRRAVVSIEPSRAEHHLQLVQCLAGLGLGELARAAAADGLARARGDVKALRAALAGQVPPARSRPVRGALTATVTWSGDGDLDVAFVDRRGRRLSGLRREGVLVEQDGARETAALAGLAAETVAVEVARFGGQGPITGELTIRTPDKTRSFPLTIEHGALRLAAVSYDPYAPVRDDRPGVEIRQSGLQVTGAIERDVVRRIMRAHINELRYCYERELQKNPALAGRVEVGFVIDAGGRVTAANVLKDTMGDPTVGVCAAGAMRRWTFPKPEGGGIVKIVAPLVFTVGG